MEKDLNEAEVKLVFPISEFTEAKEIYCLKLNNMSIRDSYDKLSDPFHKRKAIHVYETGLNFCGTCEWSYGCYQCDFVKTLRWALKRETASAANAAKSD
jgi:hypothetical protein